MNVLFLTSSLPRYNNDSQIPFVLEQALAWKTASPEDKILVLAPHDHTAKREEKFKNIHIYRFVYWFPLKWQKLAYPTILPNIRRNPFLLIQVPFFLLGELRATIRIVKRLKIDLIFAHWIMPQGLTAYINKKLLGTPYGLKNYSSDLRFFHKIPLIGRPLARVIIRNAKVMFCENKQLRKEALDLFKEEDQSTIGRKIIALCMGVSRSSDAIPTGSVPENRYDFGFIGRLTRKKGIHFFIQALGKLRQKGVTFKAAIAGDGEEADSLKAMAKKSDIDFIGFLSDQEKLDFFNQVRICVFPSCKFKGDIEGLPVALLEALLFGKIIIASKDTNIELLPEWDSIKNNIYFLENPEDIERFVNLLQKAVSLNNTEANKRTTETQSALSRYKWDNLINEYMNLLKAG